MADQFWWILDLVNQWYVYSLIHSLHSFTEWIHPLHKNINKHNRYLLSPGYSRNHDDNANNITTLHICTTGHWKIWSQTYIFGIW